MNRIRSKHLFLLLILIIIDQVTKLMVNWNLSIGDEIPLIKNFFSLVHVRNRGAAWGILADRTIGIIFLSIISFVATCIFFYVYSKAQKDVARVTVIVLIAGTVGNLIDRLRLGEVIDFIALQFGSYQYPAFNFADSCIVLAVIYLLYIVLRCKNIDDLFDFAGAADGQ